MPFPRKVPMRKGGRFVAIGTRNICSSQLERKKIVLKGPLAHGIGAREVVYLKKT